MLIYNPRQVALITCRGKHLVLGRETELDEILPLTWHSPASSHPPLYAIFVNKNLMGAKIIEQSRTFVVNFIPYKMAEKALHAMTVSGEFSDKIETIGLHPAPCEKLVDCFALQHAIGWLECEVIESKETGDSMLFLGKVVHSEMTADDNRPFHIEGDRFTTTR